MREAGKQKRRDALELVLINAGQALLQSRRRRPQWLPAGYPMGLVVTQKREKLVTFLIENPALRDHLRSDARTRALLDPHELSPLTPDTLAEALTISPDPRRLVATALLSADAEMSSAAASWAIDPSSLPAPATEEPASCGVEDSEQRVGPEAVVLAEPAPSEVVDDHHGSSPDASTESNEIRELMDLLEHERGDRESAERKLRAARVELESGAIARQRLEAQVLDLQARVPSKGQQRRAKKERREFDKSAERLEKNAAELQKLREERDMLARQKQAAEAEIEEIVDARRRAERKASTLEQRLSSTASRADYLRRALATDIEDACRDAESLPQGPARTKARRHCDELTALVEQLNQVFPVADSEEAAQITHVKVGDVRDVSVTPIGGGEEIGGSALLLRAGDARILVDAGLHPSGRGPLHLDQLLQESHLDAIVVTHAHNDHAGYIPALLSRYPSSQVLASQATAQLLPTMWNDSAKVMERAFTEASDPDSARSPLYGQGEVEYAESRVREIPQNRAQGIGTLEMTLFPAGHILGAVGVVFRIGDRKVVITGDISGPADRYLSVDSANLPTRLVAGADLLVIESTYCHDDHSTRTVEVSSFVEHVRRVVDRRGRVLVPAFGLGRAQEVAMILAEHLPEVDVLVDGLARDVSDIYERVAAESGRELSIFGRRVRRVENRAREVRSFHSGVIVSTSGMLTGGPSVEWAKEILPDKNNALLLCGYQDEDAPGRRLENLAAHVGRRWITLPDRELGTIDIEVRAEVRKYSLSAHADRRGLVEITQQVGPKQVMLVHGEQRNQREFRAHLQELHQAPVPTDLWRPA